MVPTFDFSKINTEPRNGLFRTKKSSGLLSLLRLLNLFTFLGWNWAGNWAQICAPRKSPLFPAVPGIPRSSRLSPKFLDFFQIPQISPNFPKFSQDSLSFREFPQISANFQKFPQIFPKFPQISPSFLKIFPKIPHGAVRSRRPFCVF